MSSFKRPVHPILIVLPLTAFVLTMFALVAHAATGNDVWYRAALFADVGGLAVALIEMLAGVADAASLPAFTVAREASLRQVAFSVLGLIAFAATATVLVHRYEGHAFGDATPLVLGAMGLTAMVIASWYGRGVQLAFEAGETTVRYPARVLRRTSARRAPGSALTLG
jgi:uncharacterized membrane protein